MNEANFNAVYLHGIICLLLCFSGHIFGTNSAKESSGKSCGAHTDIYRRDQ
jgi:hypothetical protein